MRARQRIFAAVNHLPMVVTLFPKPLCNGSWTPMNFPNSEFARQPARPFAVRREPLLSPWGLPCTAPPWGTLASVDLRRNRIVWQVPLGSTEGIGPWFAPTRDFGTPGMGGPIATAGDLVFIGAAMDSYFRAFDIETGRELWNYRLPAGGQATPMTYRAGPQPTSVRRHCRRAVMAPSRRRAATMSWPSRCRQRPPTWSRVIRP